MKFKFSNNMRVIGKKLDAFHRLKGFKEGEELKVYMVERSGDHDYKYWGLWVKAPRGGFECRLQDLNGNVTGHGTFFEPKPQAQTTPRPAGLTLERRA